MEGLHTHKKTSFTWRTSTEVCSNYICLPLDFY